MPWTGGDPGDFLDRSLSADDGKFRRVAARRPAAGRGVPRRTATQVVVANYLLDAVQVVDVGAGKLVRTIALGGPAQPSLARQGEALFYDAQRSHNQWFSCHTCHVDGHTCGLNFDTLNDDSYGNPKLTPTLRGVTHTGPWTWHGWQKDLRPRREILTETMFGPKPTADECGRRRLPGHARPSAQSASHCRQGMSPRRVRPGTLRGKGRCVRCHAAPEYTSEHNYDVKLEADGSPYRRGTRPCAACGPRPVPARRPGRDTRRGAARCPRAGRSSAESDDT